MGALAVLEVLDREGQARQSVVVRRWPLRVGRALDNHLVLADPHVAAHHFHIETGETGLKLTVDETGNGVQIGRRRLHATELHEWPADAEPLELTAGRTRLRLRTATQVVPAELPLAGLATRNRRFVPTLLAGLVLLAAMLFNTYLDTDPDTQVRAYAGLLLAAVAVTAVWCGIWALLSKTFTRQARLGWHLRVFVFAGIALLLTDYVPKLLAFSLSWPWLSNFDFIATYAVAAAALYYHLIGVEVSRPRVVRGAAAAGVIVAVTLTMWFNVQRSERFGDELYMSHLFPPALRLARPATTERYFEGLAALQESLDDKARQPTRGDLLDSQSGEND